MKASKQLKLVRPLRMQHTGSSATCCRVFCHLLPHRKSKIRRAGEAKYPAGRQRLPASRMLLSWILCKLRAGAPEIGPFSRFFVMKRDLRFPVCSSHGAVTEESTRCARRRVCPPAQSLPDLVVLPDLHHSQHAWPPISQQCSLRP